MPKPVYRCTSCGSLVFGRVRSDSLFGYCPTERRHYLMTLATDPEALSWARARSIDTATAPRSGVVVVQAGAAPPLPPGKAAPAEPFYPTGTDW